jgi:ABC-type transporter Mla subunit MlaD
MSAKPNYFKIGMFVILGCTILTVALLVWGAGALFREQVRAETFIDESVQGLEVGASVRYRGVKVGKVTEISFVHNYYEQSNPETDPRYALVRFTLYPDTFRGHLPKDLGAIMTNEIEKRGLRCRLAPQGVTGMLYLEVDYVIDAKTNKPIEPLKMTWNQDASRYYYIPSAPSTITRWGDSLDKIMAQVAQLLTKFNEVSLNDTLAQMRTDVTSVTLAWEASGQELRKLLTRPEVDKILQSAALAADNVSSATQSATQTMKNLEGVMSNAGGAVTDVRAFIEEAHKNMATLAKSLTDASDSVNAASQKIDQFFGNEALPESAQHLKNTLRQLDKIISNQQQGIETTLENLRRISEDIKELSRTARQNPSGTLFGTPPPQKKLE